MAIVSNKSMIEYLNKNLNEAQKFSFKNLVNHKGYTSDQQPGENTRISNMSTHISNPLRNHAISPLRGSISTIIPRVNSMA